jgi:long-chain acyl-CoA synthetase
MTPGRAWGLHGDPQAGEIAELLYTSGTTGRPKGVMRTHGNVLAASANARRAFGYRHEDVIALAMPLSHSSALVSQMVPMVELGGTGVLVERFDPESLIDTIAAECVSCLRAVPAMFRLLMASPRFAGAFLPSLRLLMNSSAAIDPATCLEVKERLPGVELVNSYGLTEASTCTILPDRLAQAHPDSIGLPIEGVEMQVAGEDGQAVADGEEGEIQVRGPHVFAGYRGLPAETGRAIAPGGWLRTGDVGARKADGLFYFRGRKDDVINCGGRKYAPLEVENCILEMPDIAEAAVVGMPHRVLGEVAKAFVVFRPGVSVDPKAVSRHCARRLPSHKVPFKVEVVSALPRNSVGKVLHRSLRPAELADCRA